MFWSFDIPYVSQNVIEYNLVTEKSGTVEFVGDEINALHQI